MKELEKICKKIDDNGFKCIILQFPEGLKSKSNDISKYIEKRTNANVMISADPCYGACDLGDFKDFGADLLIHFGHSEIPDLKDKYKIPVEFFEYRSDLDVLEIVKNAIPKLERSVGIITTVQHIHFLKKISELLLNNGLIPIIGKGDSRIKYEGQILGCNFSSAKSIINKVDCYLYIGSGNFHPLGVAISTNKNVIIADPSTGEIRDITKLKEKILRQRYGAVAKAMDAESFGIIIGLKIGQQRIELAKTLKNIVESKNKKAYLLTLREIEPLYLSSFNSDAYVSTACPRIAIDDYLRYKKPIITPIELEIALGVKDWKDYRIDEILGKNKNPPLTQNVG